LAILKALRKWRHYFLGGSLVIRTDQQSLKYIMTLRLTKGIQHKLLMKLLEFNYTIEYKRGAKNSVADALSRKEHEVQAISSTISSWITDIETSYEGDQHYTNILQQLLINEQALPHYTTHSGVLRYKGRICIEGHSGIKATYRRIKRIFCWPDLKKSVESFVAECPICQRSKGEHFHYIGLLSPLPIPNLAWSFISMDFVEGLSKSGIKNVILVVVDILTKYAHFLALSHPFTAQTVARLFIDDIFKLHGLPMAIVTENG
jgi:hypothetical protein